jgi:outer membrane protein OmpA-like peptidoglycan-associated protein
MTLIDPSNNEQYWPVTDAQNDTYASTAVGGLASTPLTLFWVTFPAPPASVTTLDVAFPNGGPQVPGIPITTAASGPTPSQVGHGAVAAPPNKFAVPPGATSTTGLTLTARPLVLGVGNPKGSDAESAGHSMITLSSDVLFHFDKSNLTPAARSILTTIAARIKAGAHGVVSVDGYTDSIGTDAVNIPLSQARARSVVSFLSPLTAGSSVTYASRGFGSADPVAPNTNRNGTDDPAGRALNRRVTIGYSVSAPVKPSPPAASTAPAASSSTPASLTAKFTVDNFGTDTYGVKIGSLFRDADMAVLRLSVNCLKVTGNSGLPCDGIENLGGDNSIPPSPGYKSIDGLTYRTVSGFYLQDASGNDYVPVYARSSGDPVTAETNQYIGTTPFSLWVYFPAPPATDSSVTVFAPGGLAKVAGVPISASAPPLP